jgi:hypothetical protein
LRRIGTISKQQWFIQKSGGDSAVSSECVIAGMIFHGIVNLKIVSRGLSLEKIGGCVSGENTGVRESTKPCIGLSLLQRCTIFCIKLTMPSVFFDNLSAAFGGQ